MKNTNLLEKILIIVLLIAAFPFILTIGLAKTYK